MLKAYVKATCFNLKSHRQAKLRTMKFFKVCMCAFGESHSPPQEWKATRGQKPAHYCMKPATASEEN